MKASILVISILLLVVFVVRAARKNMNKGESKLSVYEHSSTFKKPDIEMVSTPPDSDRTDNSFQIGEDKT